jgi:hypothetical protein
VREELAIQDSRAERAAMERAEERRAEEQRARDATRGAPGGGGESDRRRVPVHAGHENQNRSASEDVAAYRRRKAEAERRSEADAMRRWTPAQREAYDAAQPPKRGQEPSSPPANAEEHGLGTRAEREAYMAEKRDAMAQARMRADAMAKGDGEAAARLAYEARKREAEKLALAKEAAVATGDSQARRDAQHEADYVRRKNLFWAAERAQIQRAREAGGR